jgi:cell division septum initiation protein DivIVA
MIPLPLIIALAVLVASNMATGWAWLHARDQVATLQERAAAAVDVAGQCSRSVSALQDAADKRAAAARAAIAAANQRAADKGRQADQILAKAPSVPGNDCASAQAQVDEWLANRQVKP